MFLTRWIKVATGAGKRRAIAFAHRVNVDRM
jgi:hypothetical protein